MLYNSTDWVGCQSKKMPGVDEGGPRPGYNPVEREGYVYWFSAVQVLEPACFSMYSISTTASATGAATVVDLGLALLF
jgi:hypothetical protein